MEKLSSTKLVPGAKKVGDCCCRGNGGNGAGPGLPTDPRKGRDVRGGTLAASGSGQASLLRELAGGLTPGGARSQQRLSGMVLETEGLG